MASKADTIPIKRHYPVVVVALVIGIAVGYLWGFQSGETDAQLDNAKFQIKNQREVYNEDIEIDDSMPDVRDDDAFYDWLCDPLPAFQC